MENSSFSFSFIPHNKKLIILFLNISFIILLTFFLVITSNSLLLSSQLEFKLWGEDNATCSIELDNYKDYNSKCLYVKSHTSCTSKGYINYLQIFYCTFGHIPLIGHFALLLWLAVLFYLLGNTAAEYFCSSLDSLSTLLKLSPTIAGVTLLSLGNGSPDVFSSIVSFTRSNSGDVGLNSVLGGAFVVSNVVVGIISTLISSNEVSVDKSSFIRDVSFFIFSLASLLFILLVGEITLWGSLSFLSIYFLYVSLVCFMHFNTKKQNNPSIMNCNDDSLELGTPLLGYVDNDVIPTFSTKASSHKDGHKNCSKPCINGTKFHWYMRKVVYILELPLYLPRRLTIPVVNEENWSKPYAVASASLAPILLTALLNTEWEKKFGSSGSLVSYLVAGLIGMVVGNVAFLNTKSCSPPKKWLLPWLAGGFLMSVTWTYIVAEELVSLLVSIGHILGIDPSVLGLTLLAWGNSLGDLITNVAMAVKGGADGAQVAISGCYAGPMFNTLLGLGISFVISSWNTYPSSYVIPRDPSIYETLGFLMAGLGWALVVLPLRNMKLDKFLGVGLVCIYLCFLALRLVRAVGGIGLKTTL
ncbi:Cation/calcium exchanger 1 [Linum perenne]